MPMLGKNYLPYTISEETAVLVATMMLASADALWQDLRPIVGETNPKGYESMKMLEDYDWWYGISDNWDLNISSSNDNILRGWLYPVVNGTIDTDNGIELTLDK